MKKIVLLTILFLLNINFSFSQNTYPNGQIKEKGNKQNGEYILYYENGQIWEKGNFVDGESNGESIGYYENGKINYKVNFVNGKLNGEYIGYYKNGQIERKGNYVNGNEIGEWIRYYENGKIKFKGNYVDGEKISYSNFISYYENGQIERKDTSFIIKEPLVDILFDKSYQDRLTIVDSNLVGLRFERMFYTEYGKNIRKGIGFSGDLKGGVMILYNEDGSIKTKKFYNEGFSDENFKKLCQKYNIN